MTAYQHARLQASVAIAAGLIAFGISQTALAFPLGLTNAIATEHDGMVEQVAARSRASGTRNVNRTRSVNVNRTRNVNVNRTRNVNRTAVRGGARYGAWVRPAAYRWVPGGAIAAGAAIGFVSAGTAAAWAGAAPGPGLCWYYTDPSRTKGFWDACP